MELKAGYKSTELGVLPVDWKVQTIESVMSEISMGPFGSDIKVSNFVAFGVPVLSGLNVRSERLLDSFTNFVTPEKAKDLKKAVARRGDVVITHRGTLGQISYIPVDSEFDRYVISQSQFRARFNLSAVLPNWIALYFLSPLGSAKLLEGKGHTGVPALAQATTKFRQLHIPLPSLDEQRAIATALSDVDALIAGLEKLIAKKRDLKQAAMQQLLTGQNRLPGFSGEWVVKRLGEICEISMGRTPSRLNPAFWGAGHVWLSIADLHGKVLSSSKEQITPLAASSMRVIPEGTLLMSFKLSIGRLCFAGCDLYTNEAICGFNNLLANSDYLYYALSRTDFSLYGKQAVKGYTLNKKSLALVEVALPSDEEQAAIANVLSAMDEEMADLERRLSKTRNLKQGMMQELLTGRTRLV